MSSGVPKYVARFARGRRAFDTKAKPSSILLLESRVGVFGIIAIVLICRASSVVTAQNIQIWPSVCSHDGVTHVSIDPMSANFPCLLRLLIQRDLAR